DFFHDTNLLATNAKRVTIQSKDIHDYSSLIAVSSKMKSITSLQSHTSGVKKKPRLSCTRKETLTSSPISQKKTVTISSVTSVPKRLESTSSDEDLSDNNEGKEEKQWPTTTQGIIRRLIQLQKFDGLWQLSVSDIENLTSKKKLKIKSSYTKDVSILTSMIVIVALKYETKFQSYKSMWNPLVNKACKRIQELLGHGGKNIFQQLEEDVQKQI
ncbi:unnamed protein product, partial [Didymodactylos carnosus]